MGEEMEREGRGGDEERNLNAATTLSTEQIFESAFIPSWKEQLTLRAFVVGFILGFFFIFIVMRLNLTTGITPSINVAAGLLGFFFMKTWTMLLEKTGFLKQPFTRQENTVVQTCIVAASGLALSGGFGGYAFAMSAAVAAEAGDGNTPANIKNPSLGWMIGFIFVVSFQGLFSVVPMRKIMIIDHKLIYPSGTATAHLINSFHIPHGDKQAQKQVHVLVTGFAGSFVWAFFQWFFTAGKGCGFAAFPTFGLQAYQRKFYFDFSATYVGVGMICPHVVNFSLLAGSIISWGIMWPIIERKKGDWYSEKLTPGSLRGLEGYKVFIALAMILGDGLFYFIMVLSKTIHNILFLKHAKEEESSTTNPVADQSSSTTDAPSLSNYDDQRRTEIFLKDHIPMRFAIVGYVILAAVSVITVPFIFPQLKWYHILVSYLISPILAFCNSYGTGLTNWSLASSYGKLVIFIFATWVGLAKGGILAGLASCGLMLSILSTSADLMQDFRTGYMTLTSPRSMFISQVIGMSMGCVIAPCVFWIFYKSFSVGEKGSDYSAPFAMVYRGIAVLGVEGISALPKNCPTMCIAFFLASVAMCGLKELARHRKMRIFAFMPSMMAMAIPFFLGGPFAAIDMCLGSLILFVWEKTSKAKADAFAPAVASGLICGDGIWSLPASVLALVNVKPPICMKFLSSGDNAKADAFLKG